MRKHYLSALLYIVLALPSVCSGSLIVQEQVGDSAFFPTETATFDAESGRYWFTNLGLFEGFQGSGGFTTVTAFIDILNDIQYFGIGNWHLASAADMATLFEPANPNPADLLDIVNAFTPSHVSSNVFGQVTHWFGIWDEIGEDMTVVRPGFFGNPTTTIVSTHGYVDVLAFGGSALLPGGYQTGYVADDGGIDNGLGLFGAWLVGTPSDDVSVPEPGTLLLFATGLLGFRLTRCRQFSSVDA